MRAGATGLQAAAAISSGERMPTAGIQRPRRSSARPEDTYPMSAVTCASSPAASSSHTGLTCQPRSVTATTTITSNSTSPIGYASARALAQPPPVARSTVTPSSCVTTAADPTTPMAASSHSAAPMRRRRARANRIAAAKVAGKNTTKTRSAPVGKCGPPPGSASQIVPPASASSATPSASQANRSSGRRTARSSTAAAATRTGSPAATRSITYERIGPVLSDLTPKPPETAELDGCCG